MVISFSSAWEIFLFYCRLLRTRPVYVQMLKPHTYTHADTRIVPWNVQITTSHTHTHTHMLGHINIFCCLLFKQSLSTNILVSCCCLLLFPLSPFFVLLLVTLLRSGHAPLPHICPTRATGRWCICQVFEKLSIRQREQLRCDVQAQLPWLDPIDALHFPYFSISAFWGMLATLISISC